MAWTAPYTAIAGGVVSSADFNTYVRDNLNETEASQAFVVGSWFTSDGVNAISEKLPTSDSVSTSQTRANPAYGNLATVGPSVTARTDGRAVVIVGARIQASTTTSSSVKMSWAVSGATTIAAADQWAAGIIATNTTAAFYASRWYVAEGLNAGTNTFTAQYAASSGTGTWAARSIHVIPL